MPFCGTQPSPGAPPEGLHVEPAVAFQLIVNDAPGLGWAELADSEIAIATLPDSGTVRVDPSVTTSRIAVRSPAMLTGVKVTDTVQLAPAATGL